MNKLKISAYGTYKIVDSGRRVPISVINMLAPAMYTLLKEIEWIPGGTFIPYMECPCCRIGYWNGGEIRAHADGCKLRLLLSIIESWDQEKFSLSWSDYENLREIIRKVES